MATPDVAVIDYGVGNLLSVSRGLEHCGARVNVTSSAEEILAAPRVILPGVGAFGDGMGELRRRGLTDVVREIAARGVPLLGICLGMQMLLDESEEFGVTEGLGLVPGRVIPVPSVAADGRAQKVPHIGWNGLVPAEGREDWSETLLTGLERGESVYFVHSYMADPLHASDRLADCLYGDVRVCAVIARDNVFGCQFHPEKSGEVGLKVLRRFAVLR